MYIPAHFSNQNEEELFSFMQAHPFAMICSNGNPVPLLTHLPFVAEINDGKVLLTSHFSAANPQAKLLAENDEVLVVFSGPNAYISPSLYEKTENVPTWNYIAVHCSGKYRPDHSEEAKEKVLLQMISRFEPEYRAQWEKLNPDYTKGLMNGIVAFSVEVSKLEGKFKLSQNKTPAEQKRIAESLSDEEMKKHIHKNL